MHIALLILAAAFAALLVLRISAARRALLARRWPALALAAGSALALTRGSVRVALLLGAFAIAAWLLGPALTRPRASEQNNDLAEARRLLGVGPDATEAEIRRAYRQKMTRAHPDRGGAHKDAARLTAARDRLLKRRH
jgi:chromate transport protein ChrA